MVGPAVSGMARASPSMAPHMAINISHRISPSPPHLMQCNAMTILRSDAIMDIELSDAVQQSLPGIRVCRLLSVHGRLLSTEYFGSGGYSLPLQPGTPVLHDDLGALQKCQLL